jgi:hypothetical protein
MVQITHTIPKGIMIRLPTLMNTIPDVNVIITKQIHNKYVDVIPDFVLLFFDVPSPKLGC